MASLSDWLKCNFACQKRHSFGLKAIFLCYKRLHFCIMKKKKSTFNDLDPSMTFYLSQIKAKILKKVPQSLNDLNLSSYPLPHTHSPLASSCSVDMPNWLTSGPLHFLLSFLEDRSTSSLHGRLPHTPFCSPHPRGLLWPPYIKLQIGPISILSFLVLTL